MGTGIGYKGMCSECFNAIILKNTKSKYCSWYKHWCKAVARNCINQIKGKPQTKEEYENRFGRR